MLRTGQSLEPKGLNGQRFHTLLSDVHGRAFPGPGVGTNHVPPGFAFAEGWKRPVYVAAKITNARVRFYNAAAGDINYAATDGSVITVRANTDPRWDNDFVQGNTQGNANYFFPKVHGQ